MNLRVSTYLKFGGLLSDLDPFLEELGELIWRHGYASDARYDAAVSMVVVEESDIGEWESTEDFLINALKNSRYVMFPLEREDENEPPGD